MQRLQRSKEANAKKEYAPPRLTEYGTVAKLTQGNGSVTSADGKSNMVMP